jgi:hypothetical protein
MNMEVIIFACLFSIIYSVQEIEKKLTYKKYGQENLTYHLQAGAKNKGYNYK